MPGITNHRRWWIGLVMLALGLGGVLHLQAAAYPEPHLVPHSWLLDFEYNHPHAINVRLPGDSHYTTYWYFTYTVTNNTGEDRNFIPEIELLTDAGDLLQANRHLPPRVFDTICSALKNPLLKKPSQIVGRLLQGEDHAVDGIAIWKMPEHDVNEVRFFFQGLSGEEYEVVNPITEQKLKLRRAKMLEYETPGSVERQPRKPWIFKSESWVVR